IWEVFVLSSHFRISRNEIGSQYIRTRGQGRTDNSWGPRAIGDHGAPMSLPTLKKSL
ncbi:unnamed protein product, partial [Staurois parvus]